jgi:hypothetical protein
MRFIMAQAKPRLWLALIGGFYLIEALARIPTLQSPFLFLGRFFFARTAYVGQLGLTLLELFAGLAVMRSRLPGRWAGIGISLLGGANAMLVFLVPESRKMLSDLGVQMNLPQHSALAQMALPYLTRGLLHGASAAWLLVNGPVFREEPHAGSTPAGEPGRKPS